MGLFGFVGSVVKGVATGAACVAGAAALPVLGATYVAVSAAEKVAPIAGKVVKAAVNGAIDLTAEAYEHKKAASKMSDSELLNAYNSTTSATKRAGYKAEWDERHGNA